MLYEKLRKEGCSEETALEAIKTSRASFYRWKRQYQQQGPVGLVGKSKRPKKLRKPGWTKELQQLVYQVRQQYPYWGKLKIQRLLEREHEIKATVSTVGRIIHHLMQLKRILPVSVVVGHKKPKKRRLFFL